MGDVRLGKQRLQRQCFLRGLRDEPRQALRRQSVQYLVAAHPARLEQIHDYFDRHRDRIHYDRYLAAGYPIASGVIEGARRHVVKDRMERAGMHWTLPGAQALLNLRCVALNDDRGLNQGRARLVTPVTKPAYSRLPACLSESPVYQQFRVGVGVGAQPQQATG